MFSRDLQGKTLPAFSVCHLQLTLVQKEPLPRGFTHSVVAVNSPRPLKHCKVPSQTSGVLNPEELRAKCFQTARKRKQSHHHPTSKLPGRVSWPDVIWVSLSCCLPPSYSPFSPFPGSHIHSGDGGPCHCFFHYKEK